MSPSRRRDGSLAIVLHTHMPFVLGHGSWPFGEEWLWEAVATSYLPILDLLDGGAPLTLSITPVLADQLEAPQTRELCRVFLEELRPETHRLDAAELAADGRVAEAAQIDLSAARYASAAERWREIDGDLVGALAQHASWTSAATHQLLPLAAVDASVRLQVQTGIASQRRRFGNWGGGFWLPECAHSPWLDRVLVESGVRSTVVDWTDVLGLGTPENLTPHRSPEGLVFAPLDRQLVDLVWAGDGYPSDPGYRNHHGLTTHHHRAWANDGEPYDEQRASEIVKRDAAAFVSAVIERLNEVKGSVSDPLAVFAVDTELFGHWWHEGVDWLAAVVAEASERGLVIEQLDQALAGRKRTASPSPLPAATSWGRSRTLETWSSPKVAEYPVRIRAAELFLRHSGAGPEALRSLLALQASDWAFLADAESCGEYPNERANAHLAGCLGQLESAGVDLLSSLAPDLQEAALFSP